jgi:hypothetical protein
VGRLERDDLVLFDKCVIAHEWCFDLYVEEYYRKRLLDFLESLRLMNFCGIFSMNAMVQCRGSIHNE